MKPKRSVALALLAVALVVAACGGEDTTITAAGVTTTTQAATTTTLARATTTKPAITTTLDSTNAGAAMFRSDLERTGAYPSGGPSLLGGLVWKLQVAHSPVAAPAIWEGVADIVGIDGCLYAASSETGEQKWTFRAVCPSYSSPAVSGGVIYFGRDDGFVYALR